VSLLRVTILLAFGTAVQALLPHWVFAGSLDWPILTALLMVIVLNADRGAVIYAATLTGFLYDIFSPAPLGISVPFFLLIGIGLHALKTELFTDHPITYCVLGALAAGLKTLYFLIVLTLFDVRPLPSAGLIAVRSGGGFLLGALTVPAVYLAVSLVFRESGRGRRVRL
jgi:rod shape-determining protein MreD